MNLNDYLKKKPENLILDDLKWKFLVRSVLKAKNIMIVGPSGSAKTMTARTVANVLGRPFAKFNLGSTQDARATLIGNTTYNKDTGTIFHKSAFVKAITTPYSVVLLDEFTRATHDAHNILLPSLDPTQRCLRLDEEKDNEVVNIEPTVCFIVTANIGSKYTATKVLDKASSRRFPVKIEMEQLNKEQLNKLYQVSFPNHTSEEGKLLHTLTNIYEELLIQIKLEDAKISDTISVANMMEIAELVFDGFSLEEIAEVAIYPEYVDEGGIGENERVFVKSILQKYIVKKQHQNPITS